MRVVGSGLDILTAGWTEFPVGAFPPTLIGSGLWLGFKYSECGVPKMAVCNARTANSGAGVSGGSRKSDCPSSGVTSEQPFGSSSSS